LLSLAGASADVVSLLEHPPPPPPEDERGETPPAGEQKISGPRTLVRVLESSAPMKASRESSTVAPACTGSTHANSFGSPA
jgi:hypothetical protein